MEDNVGRIYIYNGELRASGYPANVDPINRREIYEVIRIIDGVPLFFEDHFSRMEASIKAIGERCPVSFDGLLKQIKELLRENGSKDCNVKVIAAFSNSDANILAYISKSYYPSRDVIEEGVGVGLLHLERQNPAVKLVNSDYKKIVNERIQKGGFFEVLLCDREGNITEGSKSNAFFVKGDKIYTAPAYSVLKGITRQYVLDACKAVGYEVIEEFVKSDSLQYLDGIFLSGTSIKVLPISSVDGRGYKSASNPVIGKVRAGFDRKIEDYISKNR